MVLEGSVRVQVGDEMLIMNKGDFVSVPADVRGKLVKCQYCQTMLRVPSSKPVAAGPAEGAKAPH